MRESWARERERLGLDRVVDPAGAMPQAAGRLDPGGPVRPAEVELAVERLCVDSTSYRDLCEHGGGDAGAIGDLLLATVGDRGKLHNPRTDSGGIMMGSVTAVGAQCSDAPEIGARVVPMASLTVIPLRLEQVVHLDPGSAQVEVEGTAYFRTTWAPLPSDIEVKTALEILDVSPAASHVRSVIPRTGTVCVLGAGHAGRLVLAVARGEMEGGTVAVVDVDEEAVRRTVDLGLCDVGITADVRDPGAALEVVRSAGVPPADLTVVVVNAPGCETTSVVLTADGGTVLLLSMATSFAAAALAGDGVGKEMRLLIGSAYSHDRGSYALDLYRGSPALREAFG